MQTYYNIKNAALPLIAAGLVLYATFSLVINNGKSSPTVNVAEPTAVERREVLGPVVNFASGWEKEGHTYDVLETKYGVLPDRETVYVFFREDCPRPLDPEYRKQLQEYTGSNALVTVGGPFNEDGDIVCPDLFRIQPPYTPIQGQYPSRN